MQDGLAHLRTTSCPPFVNPGSTTPEGKLFTPTEDTGIMTLQFANGAQGVIHVSSVGLENTHFNSRHQMEYHGSEGTLYAHTDWSEIQEVRGTRVGEGELVVTNGNFKLDNALQIAAKPSMMTPEGGAGGGHDHGGDQKPKLGETTSHPMPLPSEFMPQLEQVFAAYDDVTAAIEEADLVKIRTAFDALGQAMAKVDEKLLTGHAETLWGEFSMLLNNDVAEGREVTTLRRRMWKTRLVIRSPSPCLVSPKSRRSAATRCSASRRSTSSSLR